MSLQLGTSTASSGTAKPTTLQEQMLLIRLVEDRLQELCMEGKAGDLHFSKGQEAISVGVMSILRETDYIATHHRTIAHAISKGVPLRPLLAEILGKAEGLNGGMAGEMHMSCLEKRFMFSFQLVGTCIPVAAGIAWAVKNVKRTDDIVVVFHGDAATANGQWHEGVNIAAVQRLPLLLVCENNHLAGNVRPEEYLPVEPWARAAGYGIRSNRVDGNNLHDVETAAKYAVDYVRRESKPFLLDCDTTRLGRHKQGQGDLRSVAEKDALALRDPLLHVTFEPDLVAAFKAGIIHIIEHVLAGPDPIRSV
mgnify:CR=1 FL=1